MNQLLCEALCATFAVTTLLYAQKCKRLERKALNSNKLVERCKMLEGNIGILANEKRDLRASLRKINGGDEFWERLREASDAMQKVLSNARR